MENQLENHEKFQGALSRFCDLIVLNLCFLISCIPIVTIGAAIGGMYYVNLKTQKEDVTSVWRAYWRGFLGSVRHATLWWLLLLAATGIFFVDFRVLPSMFPEFYQIPEMMVGMAFVLLIAWSQYVLPLTARFQMGMKESGKNAFRMMVAHYPVTLLLLLLRGIPFVLCLLSEQIFLNLACVFLICGFAGINRISSYFLMKVFSRYET